MPLQINQLRFVGTGRPINPNLKNLRLTREPSALGILYSSTKSFREFQQIKKIKNTLTPEEIGRYATRIIRKVYSDSKVDLVV